MRRTPLPIANERHCYVALGDAQSMDLYAGGPGNGTASRLHRRLVEQIPGIRLVPLATDGATAATVRYVQLPRLLEMNIRPAIVTLTLGASDLSRLATGTADAVCADLHAQGHTLLPRLRQTMAANSHLVLSTLYDPSDGRDPVLSDGVERFNRVIVELARDHMARVADVYTRFHSHGMAAGDPFQNDSHPENNALYLRAGGDLAPVPNAHGASTLSDALYDVLTTVTAIP